MKIRIGIKLDENIKVQTEKQKVMEKLSSTQKTLR